MRLHTFATIEERRKALEKDRNLQLLSIGKGILTDADVKYHCENSIGSTQIPLGVAGPLGVYGAYAKGDFFVPLATTEAALIASVSRGCKAITQAGGARVLVSTQGITRGPVFYTGTIQKSQDLTTWIHNNKHTLEKAAQDTSSHIILKDIVIKTLPQYVYVRFSYDTQDAMGMNMVTHATHHLVSIIEAETHISCISLAGNYDIDKKPAWLNVISGRGKEIMAEIELPAEILTSVLKTTPEKMYEVWLAKCMIGSAISGSIGFNAHIANVIVALFIATGQDPAHVVEASLGMTTMQIKKKSLYCSVYLPAFVGGTIGGATHLPTQKEALFLMGINKEDSIKFAEIAIAAVLAGEISLIASLAEGTLAKAHQRLGGKI